MTKICQAPTENIAAKNGIWLCATCATLIDKNHGVDFRLNYYTAGNGNMRIGSGATWIETSFRTKGDCRH